MQGSKGLLGATAKREKDSFVGFQYERSSDVSDWGGRCIGSYLNGLCISLFIWSMFNRAG